MPKSMPFTDRKRLWREMQAGTATEWDIIIVGGGITGAGVLREAVRCGYKSLLIEQRDFAWGTSSRSSKMVHGGIRYLASGKFSLTRHALRERERLIREAPGLVRRMGYYFPLYKNRFPPRLAAGFLFWLYDRIAGIRDHYRLNNEELGEIFPQLDTAKLNGAYYYSDAITDDARLTLRVLQESIADGAKVLNYTRANALIKDGNRVHGLHIEDSQSGASVALHSKVVVNATGAWAERLGKAPAPGLRIRPQRGSHLLISAAKFPLDKAVFLLHPDDSRRVFVYPWEGCTVIGTTDIHHPQNLDTAASITSQELNYLLKAAQPLFPQQPPCSQDVISTWSGVRPIITSGRSADPSKASREHKVWTEPGLVSCSGGKLTSFHHMALDVISKAGRYLPAARAAACGPIISKATLHGKDVLPDDPARGELLLGSYGNAALTMMESAPADERKTIGGTKVCLAQLRWALGHESVVHLDDLMLRRTRLGLVLRDGGEALVDQLRQLTLEILDWNNEKWNAELARYRKLIKRHYSLPSKTDTEGETKE